MICTCFKKKKNLKTATLNDVIVMMQSSQSVCKTFSVVSQQTTAIYAGYPSTFDPTQFHSFVIFKKRSHVD